MNKLICLTILLVFFPIHIQFQGKDAATTGSLAILLLFFIYVIRYLIYRQGHFKLVIFVLSLSGVALISTFSVPMELFPRSFRYFINFFCALLFFLVVTNHYGYFDKSKITNSDLDTMIDFLLIMVAVQIIIGLIIYFYPPFGLAMNIFTDRTQYKIGSYFELNEGVKRLSSVIGSGEEFGELIAVVLPLLLYKLFVSNGHSRYALLLLLYMGGVVLTATRSAILLSMGSIFVFFLLNRWAIKIPKLWGLSYIILILLIMSMVFAPNINKLFFLIMARFDVFLESYAKTNSLIYAMNRKGVWDLAEAVVWPKLNLFGNGMVTLVNGKHVNFHNLYLSLLYKLGVIGTGITLFLFFNTLKNLLLAFSKKVDYRAKCLISSCILSFIVLLVNELKFEFDRGSSYQQIIWLIIAIYWIVGFSQKDRKV